MSVIQAGYDAVQIPNHTKAEPEAVPVTEPLVDEELLAAEEEKPKPTRGRKNRDKEQ